jgi:hypothetical protein
MRRILQSGFLTLLAIAGIFAASGNAQAEPHGSRNGGPKYSQNDNRYPDRKDYGRDYKRWDHYGRDYRRPVVVNRYAPPRHAIRDRDRVVIRNYVSRTWQPMRVSYAPRYLIGAPLAYGVPYYAVPRDVLVQLAPVPYGYRYVRVDDDVLLLDAAATVIDAVARLSR